MSYQTHNPTIQHGREFSAGIDSKVRRISVLPRVHYNYLYSCINKASETETAVSRDVLKHFYYILTRQGKHFPLFIYLFYNFVYFLSVYFYFWLCCVFVAARAFPGFRERGSSLLAACGLFTAVGSLAANHGLQARGLQQLQLMDSGLSLPGSRAQAQ